MIYGQYGPHLKLEWAVPPTENLSCLFQIQDTSQRFSCFFFLSPINDCIVR